MHVIRARNVNGAWAQAVPWIQQSGTPSSSRNGDVLVAPCPVTTVYERPTERMLFDPHRDANVFFHLFECLWMLSGSDDPAMLNLFVRDFGERFAEPEGSGNKSGRLWGAYGWRWLRHFGVDQVEVAVSRLRQKPDDRRTVIAMWDPVHDLWDPSEADEARGEPRDLPCNTHIYLSVRDVLKHKAPSMGDDSESLEHVPVLDLTVCCRSNDIVWGAYGANAVHFSFLQEYLAGRIGVGVGTLYQVSNNWHAYVPVLARYADRRGDVVASSYDAYALGGATPTPIGTDWSAWDADLARFVGSPVAASGFVNGWFAEVAQPMWNAHTCWRGKCPREALHWVDQVQAADWRIAAHGWLGRRISKMEAA